jgi:CelD/BcsL family acetyltransferase involved in cellulose biosynthesis
MRISVARPSEFGEAELATWRQFQETDHRLAHPFLAPEFTLAVARARRGVRVAVLEDAAGVAGFFPYEVRGRIGVPVGAGISDCQGLIHRPGVVWDPVALLRACRLPVWEFDHLIADQLPFAAHCYRSRGSPVMDLSDGYDAYLRARLAATSGSVKAALRKRRKLERERGEVRFHFDVRDDALLAILMQWKSAQYRRTRQVDRFATGWITQVVRELAASRVAGCAGTLCAIPTGDTLVAVRFGIRSRTVLADWFPAYDPGLAPYSPGVLLSLAMAEAAAAEGIQQIDLGKGEADFKDTLKSGELPVCEGMIVASRPVGLVRRIRHTAAAGLRESTAGQRLRASRVGGLLKAVRAQLHR